MTVRERAALDALIYWYKFRHSPFAFSVLERCAKLLAEEGYKPDETFMQMDPQLLAKYLDSVGANRKPKVDKPAHP